MTGNFVHHPDQRQAPFRRSSGSRSCWLEVLECRWLLSGLFFFDYLEPDGHLHGGVTRVDASQDERFSLKPIATREKENWPTTTLLDNGPSDNRVDLVFLGDGYTEEEIPDFAAHTQAILDDFFATEPYRTYASFFNVHRVDVVSNESGIDGAGNGDERDTALDAAFGCGGIDRAICVNYGRAALAARNAPDMDQAFMLANTTDYGGTAFEKMVVMSGNNEDRLTLALHEFGHTFAGLADEYDYGDGAVFTGAEPTHANITTFDREQLAAEQRKWHRWLDHPEVDVFEGAAYHEFDVYRPTAASLMRVRNGEYGPVNTEQLVLEMYRQVRPIETSTPGGVYPNDYEFEIDVLELNDHELNIQWYINGVLIDGATNESFNPASVELLTDINTVSVRVVDNTNMVRQEALRESLLTDTRQWLITDSGVLPPQVLSAAAIPRQVDSPAINESVPPTSWAEQRSMLNDVRITLNQPVQLSADAIQVWNLGTVAGATPELVPLDGDEMVLDGNTIDLLFTEAERDDGIYQVRIDSAHVTDPSGVLLDGDGDGLPGGEFVATGNLENGIFQLTTDWNGDGSITFFDFLTFLYWFGEPVGVAPQYADANQDGGVSVFDFAVLVANFGTSLSFANHNARSASAPQEWMVASPFETVERESVLVHRGVDELLVKGTRPLHAGFGNAPSMIDENFFDTTDAKALAKERFSWLPTDWWWPRDQPLVGDWNVLPTQR